MWPINSLNLYASFLLFYTLGGYSENNHNKKIAFNFIKYVKEIGSSGMLVSCIISNVGKTNSSGRLIYGGSVTHNNPLFDLLAAKGSLFYFRFSI